MRSVIEGNRSIVIVSGNLCSGKGTYCTKQYPNHHHITTSSIVKGLLSNTTATRSVLSTTKHLDLQIANEMIRQIVPHEKVVIDGIRQLSILKCLQAVFGDQIENIIWLDVHMGVLEERFANRAHAKDDQGFWAAHKGDINIGINDVEDYIFEQWSEGSTVFKVIANNSNDK